MVGTEAGRDDAVLVARDLHPVPTRVEGVDHVLPTIPLLHNRHHAGGVEVGVEQ